MKDLDKLSGFEAYRDIYFNIGGEEVLSRFGTPNVRELFNGVYTKSIDAGGEIFESTKAMTDEGYFYIPTRTIIGEIAIRRDFNLIDEFEITVLSNFLETRDLKITEHSTGNEKFNSSVAGSKANTDMQFGKGSLPYYPLMDTILIGNLHVKARMGYVANLEHSIILNGVCVGLRPTFRKDGLPVVTFTFRDVGWALGKHVISATYPALKKDTKIDNIAVKGNTERND